MYNQCIKHNLLDRFCKTNDNFMNILTYFAMEIFKNQSLFYKDFDIASHRIVQKGMLAIKDF